MKNKVNYKSLLFEAIVALFISCFVGVAVSLAVPVNPLWVAGSLMAVYIAQVFGVVALSKRPVRGLMLMALSAYNCTDVVGDDVTYTAPENCISEGTGILGVFLVKGGFNLNTITDESSLAAAITALNVIPIRDLEAYWPTASPVFVPGKSGRIERLARIEYDMPFSHEGVDANLRWWNAINNSRSFGIIFVTEDYKAFTPLDRALEPVLCSIFAAPGGNQEFGGIREMRGNIKWKSRDLVQYLDLFTTAMLTSRFQPS